MGKSSISAAADRTTGGTSDDVELAAMRRLADAWQGVPDEARARVLAWFAAWTVGAAMVRVEAFDSNGRAVIRFPERRGAHE